MAAATNGGLAAGFAMIEDDLRARLAVPISTHTEKPIENAESATLIRLTNFSSKKAYVRHLLSV
jgi:hypothetical protein